MESDNNKKMQNNVNDPFPIVAIGASAGGLDALIQFFKPIPPTTNMAFVVITHLGPEHKSCLPALIQQHTLMQVEVIEQESNLKSNTIYMIPPNKNLIIKNNAFFLVAPEEPNYTNLPINYFFHSLALAYNKNAIAVVMSGCGMDGSLGIRDIKQHGGIVVVQDPETTQYSSMPQSAINTGWVDCIAKPEKLFFHIMQLRKQDKSGINNFMVEMQEIFAILRTETGYDFSGYKTNVLKRRLEKQITRLHINNLRDYIDYLRLNSHEAIHLFKNLLIGVTSFFRDPETFIELKKVILPLLFKNKPSHYNVRIWVPGCSTGEEVYSLAILIKEHTNDSNRDFRVQIFATDINSLALDVARSGIYPDTISNDVNQDRLNTWFIKEKDKYRIRKEIREMVVFGIQNLVQDPPFTKMDLISCRNLLIYLNTSTQKRLFPLFHYSLKPHGMLFLGASESASQYTNLFTSLRMNGKFFEKVELMASGYAYVNRPIGQTLLKWIPSGKSGHIDKQLLDVEAELHITQENLQATIEANEANNEEMQSTKEEFQSINEELETSKEELQSVNEELWIVNTELENRIEQLAAVNDDMNNLFNSTDIAAIFLDNLLSIKRFTPQAQNLVHLIASDIGRAFSHFSTNIKNSNLIEQSEMVLKTLQSKTFEVQSKNDRWYLVNILPYRTLLNVVDGVVITFVDITQNKLDKEHILYLHKELDKYKKNPSE